VCDSGEPSLASQSAEVVCDLGSVKLLPVIEDHCARDTKAGDDILPNEFTYFGGSDGSHSFSLDPLCEVIYDDEEVLLLPCGPGKGPSISIP